MKIYCPNCGVKGSAEDSYSGRKIRCPRCQDEFMLNPDMAIDQDDIPAASLGGQGLADASLSSAQDDLASDLLKGAGLGAVAGAGLIVSDSVEEDEISLDFDEDDLALGEESVTEEEGDESLDWEDFGAELDKEIAESEALEQEEDVDTLSVAEEDLGDVDALDDSLAAEDFEEELGEVFDDSLDADLAGFDEELSIDEEGIESLDADDVEIEEVSDDLLTDLSDDADDILGAIEDEDLETLEDLEVEAVEDEAEDSDDLEASDVVMPLFVNESTEDEEEDGESLSGMEDSLDFADEDLPEEELSAESAGLDEEAVTVEPEEETAETEVEQKVEIEEEPYGLDKEQCWQCGKKDSAGEPFVAIDGRLYCTECMPAEEPKPTEEGSGLGEAIAVAGAAAAAGTTALGITGDDAADEQDLPVSAKESKFTVGGILRESWEKVKGIKGAVWAGSAVMYAVLLVVIAGDAFLMPSMISTDAGIGGYLLPIVYQIFVQVLTMLFIGGLLFMGIRRAAGDPVSWKMIFHGFSFTGKIVVVTILQFILITIGYMLLILPGIYLTVGYLLAIPLIVDKNVAPWQALEMSRKAIHKVWWKVLALYIVMGLIFIVASIPLGIGLIWAWPMAMVVAGVVYHRLFRV